MFKLKYKLARFILRVQMFFTEHKTENYYRYFYLLQDIYDEEYYEDICRKMNQNLN